MASIIKRRKKYSVVYRYVDENGIEKQKWETFATAADAKKRKAEIENQMESGTFSVPTATTLHDLLEEYLSTYGVNTWAMSTYDSNASLIRNYVEPLIGDMQLKDITPRVMDQYYKKLLGVKAVVRNNRKPQSEFVTPRTVHEVHKILRNAFNQAVRWELIDRNPVENASLPKAEQKERDIWTREDLLRALEVCADEDLSLAINLAFACSLRMGELLGLTWDCVDISQESIKCNKASIYINKALQRCTRESLEALNDKGIIYKFPPAIRSTHTALVLKEPKTKTSIRRIFLPRSVAEMLIEHKQGQDELKELLGDEYTDHNLVFTCPNGRPIEHSTLERSFKKLIRENDLPDVVFHSLRHTSITYKLKLNGGDMKSVQGDSGHAQLKMVADVYSHIIDEDRSRNAELIEEAFYGGLNHHKNSDAVDAAASEGHSSDIGLPSKAEKPAVLSEEVGNHAAVSALPSDGDASRQTPSIPQREESDAETLMRLLQKPEMAALLKTLASSLQ